MVSAGSITTSLVNSLIISIFLTLMKKKSNFIIYKKAKLRYELQTNKPMTAINDGREDEIVWNDYLIRRQNMETDGAGLPPRW